MRIDDVDLIRFVAVIDHPLGQTRSSRMTAKMALKVAKLWMKHGDRDVRIETSDSGASWDLCDFAIAMSR